MRILLGIIKIYLGIGFLLGLVLFGSVTLHRAMSVPETPELVQGVLEGLMSGGIRIVMWAPDLYRRVGVADESIVTWLLYAKPIVSRR